MLSLSLLAEYFARDANPRASQTRVVAIMLLVFAGAFVFVVGLIARHRGLWWVPLVAWLLLGSVVLGILGFMSGSAPVAAFATGVGGATMTGATLGVFLEGALPRVPVFLMLVTEGFGRDSSGFVELVTVTVGAVGFTWLAMAMWREPLAGSEPRDEILRGAPVPA